jgi:NAD(P)-dependent dehydrogenase (short-subunit alcohol dehydrogenase family)
VRDHPESDRSKGLEGLKDKVIVFAGAGGIATATARYLGQGGAKVVVGNVLLASAHHARLTPSGLDGFR